MKSHTVRTADGKEITLKGYTRGLAIKLHCSECMGWEGAPKDCTATKCPLYPYREKTIRAHKGE